MLRVKCSLATIYILPSSWVPHMNANGNDTPDSTASDLNPSTRFVKREIARNLFYHNA